MNEPPESPKPLFTEPDIFAESGELKRVAVEFGIDSSILQYQAQQGKLVELSNDVWELLENTDSNDIETGNFEKVAEFAGYVHRDWESLHERLKNNQSVEAPIIMKFGDRYHLVAGNTRLMVAKAMGIKPSVLMFEI